MQKYHLLLKCNQKMTQGAVISNKESILALNTFNTMVIVKGKVIN